ncbi:pro-resilin-like isoform X2 [Palaemon carinicauda]|uniref:pro-resilin-like isoform X2 n=1 Tax=Palaemon carinicauda TaxID=392227 RepID=UPI0035B5DD1A
MKVFAVLTLAAGASALAAPSRSPFGYTPGASYHQVPSYSSYSVPSYSAPSLGSYSTYVSPRSYPTKPAYEKPAPYNFDYVVKDYSGNDFGHHESTDGHTTYGAYYVDLPDGRRQKVTYTVSGDSGYVAEVTYEGEAKYPVEAAASSYQPSYVYTYG